MKIHALIGSDYISGTRELLRITERFIAADSIFGYLLQGREEINFKDRSAKHVIAENEGLAFGRVKNMWLLEAIGINLIKKYQYQIKKF